MTFARTRLLTITAGLALTLVGCSSSSPSEGGATSDPPARTSEATCNAGAAPKFGAKPSAFDAPVDIDPTGALVAQVSEPALDSATPPSPGYKVAALKVQARVATNGVFAVHPESFVLADRAGNRCSQPATNSLSNPLAATQVDESKAATGSVAFIVPAEANLSDYTVYYLEGRGSNTAVAAWSGSGTAPSAQAMTTCSSNKSGINLAGAKDQEFGKPFTAGDNDISLTLTPARPTTRDLKPGQSQPNDVSGVQVQVKVSAKGSAGFIERNQLQLLDDKGNLCRYNELGSDGENLSSDLVEDGKDKTYSVVFWTPKGSTVAGWKLLYVPEPTAKKATASWTLKPATPSSSPSSSSTSSSSTGSAPASSAPASSGASSTSR